MLHHAAVGGSVAALDLICAAYETPPLEVADQVSNGALLCWGRCVSNALNVLENKQNEVKRDCFVWLHHSGAMPCLP